MISSPESAAKTLKTASAERDVGQELQKARHDVGEPHDPQVVVADVAHLVGEHAARFP